MRDITIRIRKTTPEEKKKSKGKDGTPSEYAVIFVGKEKMCETCGDRIECLIGTEKCQAYHADGKEGFGSGKHTIDAIITWAKELCGEL
jgi:hypothetical protein